MLARSAQMVQSVVVFKNQKKAAGTGSLPLFTGRSEKDAKARTRPKLRVTINIGPEAGVMANELARKLRMESGQDWSLTDVMESLAYFGLRARVPVILKRECKLL